MAVSLERSLRHMAWANQKVFSAVGTLPDEALKSYLINPDWTAGTILEHICSGATWYVFRLEIEDWIEIPKPITMADVAQLSAMLAELDSLLVSAAAEEDRELTYTDEEDGRVVTRWRSTILSQAVHHATEHRAQLLDALEFRGFTPIILDDIDLWQFDESERQSHG